MEIIVFDTDPAVVRALRESIKLPYFSVLQGNGKEATREADLDALWMTWMQAERFGITPSFEPHKAKVFSTRAEDIQRGFPPFIIAGVALAHNEVLNASDQLELIVRSMMQAIEDHYAGTGIKLQRIGTIPENLLLKELPLEEAARIISAVFADTLETTAEDQ